ncbi:MAG: oxidoreductase [Flavobacteriaceae bacterium]
MKRFSLLILVAIIFSSCKEEYQPRVIENITIKEFKLDSLNIRTIKVLNKNEVHYAAANGELGKITNSKKSKLHNVKHDSLTLNYRSLAYNGKYFFALSISNPALLYRYNENEIQLVYKEEHEKVFYDSMKFFADGKHGIAVGDPTENCASIILTSNGGNTWSKIPCNKLPVFEDGEAFFAASNTNIKIINNTVWIASGGKKARVLKSTDMGQTWKIYDTPIIQGNGPQGIYSIDFFDENIGIIIGGDYSKPQENKANKAITIDGGKTWTLVANGQNPSYKSCVQYVPNTNGKEIFAIGKTGISFSNDGGKTWKEISKDSYYTIQFVDRNTAWLSGHEKIGKLILQ